MNTNQEDGENFKINLAFIQLIFIKKRSQRLKKATESIVL